LYLPINIIYLLYPIAILYIKRKKNDIIREPTVSRIMRKSLGPAAWGRIIVTIEKGRDRTR